jgi:hypothetical protein
LSQSSKKPGAKDISDLKARLGLKKSGAAAPAKGGGLQAPPGARGGVIPAPPGAHPPRPQIPDAKDDPFGAMNAMAAHAQVAAQPQIIVVNDGAPVEQVRRKANMRLAILGAVALVPLILGIMVGKISSGGKNYNRTIEDAALIRDDVKKVRDGLIGVSQVLANAKLRGKGGYPPGDAKMTAELEALPPLTPNIEVVFNSFMYDLPPELVAATLSFYVDAIDLNDMVKKHVQASKADEKVLKEGLANLGGFDPRGYGAILNIPSEDEQKNGNKYIGLKMVQLGTPVCEGEKTPSEQGCGSKSISGFRWRPDETAPWNVKKVATGDSPDTMTDSLVLLHSGSKVLQQLVKGGKATVAEATYADRVTKIEERVNNLIELEKGIETRLNNKANEGKRFTFFM